MNVSKHCGLGRPAVLAVGLLLLFEGGCQWGEIRGEPARTARAAAQLVAGDRFTCAVLDNGEPRCWGKVPSGEEIGDNETVDRAPPMAFASEVKQLVAGTMHVCARLNNGRVRCWGSGMTGATGSEEFLSFDDAKTGAPLSLGGRAIALAAGDSHTCAVLANGSARCWGFGGQPGTAAQDPSGAARRPLEIEPLPLSEPAVDVFASGPSNCFSLSSAPHQICLGTDGLHRVAWMRLKGAEGADEETGLLRVRDFAVDGLTDACLIDARGDVRCWDATTGTPKPGWRDGKEWADPETGKISLPSPATDVTHGYGFACARLDTGDVYCWGSGSKGQLGRGVATTGAQPPTKVEIGGRVESIASGDGHTCARLESGSVRCWGANMYGQLGYGHTRAIGDDETPATAGDVPLG